MKFVSMYREGYSSCTVKKEKQGVKKCTWYNQIFFLCENHMNNNKTLASNLCEYMRLYLHELEKNLEGSRANMSIVHLGGKGMGRVERD